MDTEGLSSTTRDLLDEAEVVAAHDLRILVTGEPGTGKEWLARFIHGRSARADEPFLTLNTASLGGELVPDVVRREQGTVLLRGIDQLSGPSQWSLTEWLEHGRPGGAAHRPQRKCRLVCSAAPALFERVSRGEWRGDLFYRLNTVHLHVPPLRERRDDVEPLARHFVSTAARRLGVIEPCVSPSWLSQYEGYAWPGNVRELQEAAEALVMVASRAGAPGRAQSLPDARR